jgi:quercetin dioxygenase-like cupin family protein
VAESSSGRPYTESGNVRTFDPDVDAHELVWHRDREDRTITVLEGDGWGIQFDNQLPQPLLVGDNIFIEKMTYHRLLLGTSTLRVHIDKH